MSTILTWLSPPLLGAFIGYLTNRVAIRMLFRPLKPWRLFGRRLPMTPGVIPAKRHELATNFGEMVGEHLLTNVEVSRAISGGVFQRHLREIIEARVASLLHKDLGPLPTLVPERFLTSFTKGINILRRRFLKQVRSFIVSDQFTVTLSTHLEGAIDEFLGRDLAELLHDDRRVLLCNRFGEMTRRIIDTPELEAEIRHQVEQLLRNLIDHQQSLRDLMPLSLQETVQGKLEEQIPGLLHQLAALLDDEDVRKQLAREMVRAIQGFVASLGPLGAMAGNFLTPKLIESKVEEYLTAHREEIGRMLVGDSVRKRLTTILRQQLITFLNVPVGTFMEDETGDKLVTVSQQFSDRIVGLVRHGDFADRLVEMFGKSVDGHNHTPLSELLGEVLGDSSVSAAKSWLVAEVTRTIQSNRVRKMLDRWLSELLEDKVLNRPVGRLADILPADIRTGICGYVMKLTSDMLVSEVPGMLDSLNIKQLVVRKVDSLDLLQLERLLLSIMEEQFKYINLFGALLGFMLGCLNLFFLLAG